MDPDYALAYIGYADALATTAHVGLKPAIHVFPRAVELVNKALELDPQLAEAHDLAARIKFVWDHDWVGAIIRLSGWGSFGCKLTACPSKGRCCANTPYRKIARSVHEAARDVAREVAKTPAYRRTRRQRKQVEMLFGHMKRILKVDRLRLRGLSGALSD